VATNVIGTATPLLRLIDRRRTADEPGVTRAAAEKVMRQVPKVHLAGSQRRRERAFTRAHDQTYTLPKKVRR
jgi:hypothetical protein